MHERQEIITLLSMIGGCLRYYDRAFSLRHRMRLELVDYFKHGEQHNKNCFFDEQLTRIIAAIGELFILHRRGFLCKKEI